MSASSSWDVGSLDSSFHDGYHTLDDIITFGDALAAGFDGLDGLHVESFVLNQTTEEGRDIRGWKAWIEPESSAVAGKKGRKGRKDAEQEDDVELEFVVQSGQHAREVSYTSIFRLAL
jgi:hypothetical protein